ncbi:AMP-binding protein [Solimonas terrae]|uniref:AMP-binding protein n=1 Tax=Solimonas terrae TaxID=1396819 RepID=A0A6M2BJZ6_9GAMM|nr:AMP-binding protein [Solimonas terrae]NGY03252.1 AMP-binding protein [Solimonas terrae]
MTTISVTEALHRHAIADADRPALTVDGQTLTRGELESRTNRLAREFERLGVREGSFVTIALPNSLAFVESALAALKLGATPQPVSSRLPQAELAAIVALAAPALLVGADAAAFPGTAVIGADFAAAAAWSDAPLPLRTAKYWKAPTSGGSTGRPKLIVAGSPAVVDEQPTPYAMPLMLPLEGAVLVPGPLYHNAPFTTCLQALFRGNHVVVMRRFDPLQTLQLIEQHRVNSVLMVPTMMSRIWKLSDAERAQFDLSSLRVVYHMASHCPAWLKAAWIDWLGAERIYELYGGTEMQALTVIRGDEWLQRRGSVGRCVLGEIKVVGEGGQALPPGEVGEILVRSPVGAPPSYFYIGAEARRVGDWDSLGDIGHLDADGYLYLADRRTDLILRGGANIYPAEVEAAIDEHPAVHSSAVIGLPDDDLGQRVHAIVHARTPIGADELGRHLAARLVNYKIPASFEFVAEPVRGDDGKVRRSALRDARLVPAAVSQR